jgi:hypothetical protein
MGSVVTTIFFAEVATYYDGAKDKHPQGGSNRCLAKNLVLVTSISSARHLPGGHYGQLYYGRQDKVSRKNIT